MRSTAALVTLGVVIASCTSSAPDAVPTTTTSVAPIETSTTTSTTTTIPPDAVTTTEATPGPTRSDTFTTLFPNAPDGAAFYSPPEDLPGITGDVLWAAELDEVPGGRAFQMLYRSQTVSGAPSAVSGWVMVPEGAAPDGGFPVIGWAPDVQGLADACATTRTLDPPAAIALLDELLAEGFVVVSTDYEGMGTPGDHPFGVSTSEGQALLDAVRAAQQFVGGGNEVFLMGEGQGGHAAVAAAEQASRYAPELPVSGVIASATQVFAADNEMVTSRLGTPEQGLVVMHAMGQASAFGGQEAAISRWLTDGGAGLAELGKDLCLEAYLAAFAPVDPAALFVEGAPQPFASGDERLAATSIGSQPTGAPLLLLHGRTDAVTPPAVVPVWGASVCPDTSVELVWFDTSDALIAEAEDAAAAVVTSWLDARLSGASPTDQCGALPQPTD